MAQLTVNAIRLKQQGHQLYLFSMNSSALKKLCYVTPRSKNDPKEIQRLFDDGRAKEIGEYIKAETAMLPNAIVISLNKEVQITKTGSDNQMTITFPAEQGKFGYILDGQHRLGGFDHSDGVEFDLPVVAVYDASEDVRGKIFADINSKQVKVSEVLLLELNYQIRELPTEEAATMDVVHRLADDPDSPLYGKIKTNEDEKGCWVTNKHMKQCLAPHTESGGVLSKRNVAQQAQILKEYLKGVKDMWPDAWGNNKEYMLTKAMGIEVVFSIFTLVKHRCDLNCGKQYTAKNFRDQISVIDGYEMELPGGGKIPLTWEKGKIGSLANRAGRSLISKELKNALNVADEA